MLLSSYPPTPHPSLPCPRLPVLILPEQQALSPPLTPASPPLPSPACVSFCLSSKSTRIEVHTLSPEGLQVGRSAHPEPRGKVGQLSPVRAVELAVRPRGEGARGLLNTYSSARSGSGSGLAGFPVTVEVVAVEVVTRWRW